MTPELVLRVALLVLVLSPPAPGDEPCRAAVVFVADVRPGAGPSASAQLTLFARFLLGEEPADGPSVDAAEPELPPWAGEELPVPGEAPAALVEALRARGVTRGVIARVAEGGKGLLAVALLVDAARAAVLARATSTPAPGGAGQVPVPEGVSALALALGKLLGRGWDPFQVTLAHLEASCRAGDPLAAEGAARALLTSHEDAQLHRILARVCEARGDLEGALGHRKEAVRLAPEDPSFRRSYAAALDRAGDPVAASWEYRAALTDSVGEARAAVEASLRALDEPRRREEARRAAWNEARTRAAALRGETRALENQREDDRRDRLDAARARLLLSPAGSRARLELGALLVSERRLGAAVEELRRAVELDPRSGAAQLALGRALFLDGPRRDAEARIALGEAARLLPADPEPLIVLGDLEARAAGGLDRRWSEHAAGVPAFDLKAYEQRPEATGDRPPRARGADPDRAAALYRQAAAIAPNDARAAARSADSLLAADRTDEATRLAEAALRAGGYPDARRVLAGALQRAGDAGGAEREMARFIAASARSAPERARAVRRLVATGLLVEAGAVIAEGLREEPAAADLLLERARLGFHGGRPEEALGDLRLATTLLEREPSDPASERLLLPHLSDLGEALLALKRPAEALAELERPRRLLVAEEARLRGSRLPRPAAELRGELTRPRSPREEPVDFTDGRVRAGWARLRLLLGRARAALGDREGARLDLRWAARSLAVDRGRVRLESEWPTALPPGARALAAEAVAELGLVELAGENRRAAGALLDLGRRLGAGLPPSAGSPAAEQLQPSPGRALRLLEESLR